MHQSRNGVRQTAAGAARSETSGLYAGEGQVVMRESAATGRARPAHGRPPMGRRG